MIHWGQVTQFVQACEKLGIEPPRPLARGLELKAKAEKHVAPRPTVFLDIADEDIEELVVDLAIRSHTSPDHGPVGMGAGVNAFIVGLIEEVHAATVPLLEDVIAQLRPGFDAAAAPFVVAAQDYGFTRATTSDAVLDLADEKAAAAWRATRPAQTAIQPYIAFRQLVSELFQIAPTPKEVASMFKASRSLDWSVCFAAGDNWSYDGGYYEHRNPDHHLDWLALAHGGLRLNSPSEVHAKQVHRARHLPVEAVPLGSVYAINRPKYIDPTDEDLVSL